MSDDIEKEKKKAELENLGRLVDRYAQSRSLGFDAGVSELRGFYILCKWQRKK